MSGSRKSDHIEYSKASTPAKRMEMLGSHYEPMLSAHPTNDAAIAKRFLGHSFRMPLWVSSMTGGAHNANRINHNLARACGEFGLGMGLGSCRTLLDSDTHFDDFNVKHLMGDAPLFMNIGVAQLETLVRESRVDRIAELIEKLRAQGLVIHINPLQEWFQPEGDRFRAPPIDTVAATLEVIDAPVIVKEVGQGMGPKSLHALASLPIAAIELAGYGGTNFSILEQMRSEQKSQSHDSPGKSFAYVGHTAKEMVQFLNILVEEHAIDTEIIISGGINDVVYGHVLMQQLQLNSVLGMASALLQHANGEYETLRQHLTEMRECFLLAASLIHGAAK